MDGARRLRVALATFAVSLAGLVTAPVSAAEGEPEPRSSAVVTWDCTSSPCPWGDQTSGHAATWPAEADPTRNRHGYTTSDDVYAPGTSVSGHQVTIHTGSAGVYAGTPTGSHGLVEWILTGVTVTLPAIGAGEVFSIQSGDPFTYTLTPGTVPDPDPDPEPDPDGPSSSSVVTWDCTGSPCPWGDQTSGQAAVWPAELDPTRNRHGYTTSADVYAPGTLVAGFEVTIHSGSAGIYAGTPAGSHRALGSISSGDTVTLPAIGADEVFSVQSGDPFTYTLTPGTPTPPADPPCEDPTVCDPVAWTPTVWICNIPGCTDGDWVGGVIAWPAWAAYDSNGRSGGNSRTVHAADGTRVHAYMGPWADGCEVTAVTGEMIVIEWERGTDVWRETLVGPGETHTIQLVGPENSAMVETPNNSEPFTASVTSCTPQPINAG